MAKGEDAGVKGRKFGLRPLMGYEIVEIIADNGDQVLNAYGVFVQRARIPGAVVECICTSQSRANDYRKGLEGDSDAVRAWVEPVLINHYMGDSMRRAIQVRLGNA